MVRTTRTRFWRTAPGVAALAALALTACAPDDDAAEFEDSVLAAQTQATGGGGEPGEDDGEQTQQEEPAEAEATDTESADAEAAQEEDGDTSGNAEDVTLDPADALQTYAYPIAHESGEVEGEITVGVHAVTVEGETLCYRSSPSPRTMRSRKTGRSSSMRCTLADRTSAMRSGFARSSLTGRT